MNAPLSLASTAPRVGESLAHESARLHVTGRARYLEIGRAHV